MTKLEELSHIADCINKLGHDSYCGAWLESLLPEIESLMRSDMIPDITLAETRSQCEAMRKESLMRQEKIINEAEKQAENKLNEAERKYTAIREILRRDINKALDLL
jgi:hypothetical protein